MLIMLILQAAAAFMIQPSRSCWSADADLASRFGGPTAAAKDEEEESAAALASRAKLQEQREPAGEAALAAASWGTWRVKAPSNATARAHHVLVESESVALELLKKLTFGADIRELAAQHSSCPSKDNGGDLGVFRPGDMVEGFDALIFDETSPIGVPLGPVRTPFGFHVVIIDGRTA